MRKTFAIEELDCAVCAQKIEDAINKLPEVVHANVNFFSQKIVIEAAEDTDWDALLEKVIPLCKRVEPDCSVYPL